MNEDKKQEYRRNAVGTASAGGATFGAGAYLNRKAEDKLKASGKPGIWDATKARKFSIEHAHFAGKKLGARSLQVTGLPLAAYGIRNIIKPTKNRPVDLHHDVIAPVAHNALLTDQVKRGEHRMSKAVSEERIIQRKNRSKRYSRVSGTLGLAALAARSPEAAVSLTRRSKDLAKNPNLLKLAAKEPTFTRHSNTLGIGAIGVGSLGSFNNAKLQGLEAKRAKEQINKSAKTDALKRIVPSKLRELGFEAQDLRQAVKDSGLRQGVKEHMDYMGRMTPSERITAKRVAQAEAILKPGDKLGRITTPEFDKPYQVGNVTAISPRTRSEKLYEMIGGRRVAVTFKPAKGGRSVGEGDFSVSPTGRFKAKAFKIKTKDPMLMHGISNKLTENIRSAKTPGINFQAGSYTDTKGKVHGQVAWEGLPGTRYVPGVGYGRAGLFAFHPPTTAAFRTPKGTPLSVEGAKAARRHVIRAATGRATPRDARHLPYDAREFVKTLPWQGHIPGRVPFLGKTKIAAGTATGVGGTAYYEENKHPRATDGKFRSKGGLVQKDAFLDQYRNRISPKAEKGYKHLRSGARSRNIDAGTNAVLGAGLIGYSVRDLRHKNPLGAAVGTLGGALTLKGAHDNAREARSWNAKANKIKAKAYEREKNGEWGRDRQSTVAKAMWIEKGFPVKAGMAIGRPKPIGMMRRSVVRSGHLMHTASGKIVTVRGSIG
jgi:hypothetical protein